MTSERERPQLAVPAGPDLVDRASNETQTVERREEARRVRRETFALRLSG
jgi:hypothetical protein